MVAKFLKDVNQTMSRYNIVTLALVTALTASASNALPRPDSKASPKPADKKTDNAESTKTSKSGKWVVGRSPLRLAGVTCGTSSTEVLKSLGKPNQKSPKVVRGSSVEDQSTEVWSYRSKGLTVEVLDGLVIEIAADRPCELINSAHPELKLPTVGSQVKEITAALGKPIPPAPRDPNIVYKRAPDFFCDYRYGLTTLSFMFRGGTDTCIQIRLIGQVKKGR